MPLNIFGSKDTTDYKARLERKLCVARETPEAVFDLSECKLKTVPSGVFSLCKVLRKEALFLQYNLLTSLSDGGGFRDLVLLKILDIHSNNLSHLPEDLDLLVNLEILNVSKNKITSLPASLGRLQSLRCLLASNNKLKKLPSLVRCYQLKCVDIQGNPMQKLPPELAHLEGMEIKGEECGMDCAIALSECVEATSALKLDCDINSKATKKISTGAVETEFFLVQERLKVIQQQKEAQKQERIAWEKSLLVDKEQAFNSKVKDDENVKLLNDIKSMDYQLAEELAKVQQRKDSERCQLVQQCLTAEELLNRSVECMLENTRRSQGQLTKITADIDEQFLYNTSLINAQLNTKHVLDAMEDLLKEELEKAEKVREYDIQRTKVVQNWIVEESEMSSKLAELAAEHKSVSSKLTEALMQDERLQKAAVASMMEISDTKTWQLAHQVSLIEKQLAELTKVELKRRKSTQKDTLTELSVSRVALTELLMDALAQQQNRREELLRALQRLESKKGCGQEEYWLQEYHRLLHSTSHQLVKSMQAVDRDLQETLASKGVLHFLPLLAKHLITNDGIRAVNDDTLINTGIESKYDREVILDVLSKYLDGSVKLPSAPPLETADEPSAPPWSPADDECVICMAAPLDALFLPCGHICCCTRCASLSECPLCRAHIENVIRVRSRR